MQEKNCTLCPRGCNIDRTEKTGFCKSLSDPKVARADLHMWEEPCISGKHGSGTVFFSGCSLKCVFCQNHEISHGNTGETITVKRLSELFLMLQDKGAHNINLVNPTHYSFALIKALAAVKHKLYIPVVWNSSGYEKAESIEALNGYIDIFLPDLKYVSPDISLKYSGASDYFSYASGAIKKMFELVGYPQFDDDGIMKKGVLVRHLVLPSHVAESYKVIDHLAINYDTKKLYVSLMCQYFPTYKAFEYKEISRKLTTLEYNKVIDYAVKNGITNGFLQERNSAKEEYVPQFSDKI